MSAPLFPRTPQRADRLRAAIQPLLPLTAPPSRADLPEPVRQQCLELLAELFNALLRAEGNHPPKEAAEP